MRPVPRPCYASTHRRESQYTAFARALQTSGVCAELHQMRSALATTLNVNLRTCSRPQRRYLGFPSAAHSTSRAGRMRRRPAVSSSWESVRMHRLRDSGHGRHKHLHERAPFMVTIHSHRCPETTRSGATPSTYAAFSRADADAGGGGCAVAGESVLYGAVVRVAWAVGRSPVCVLETARARSTVRRTTNITLSATASLLDTPYQQQNHPHRHIRSEAHSTIAASAQRSTPVERALARRPLLGR
jgi:hypothetical protein